jgi:hypothetical protein
MVLMGSLFYGINAIISAAKAANEALLPMLEVNAIGKRMYVYHVNQLVVIINCF